MGETLRKKAVSSLRGLNGDMKEFYLQGTREPWVVIK